MPQVVDDDNFAERKRIKTSAFLTSKWSTFSDVGLILERNEEIYRSKAHILKQRVNLSSIVSAFLKLFIAIYKLLSHPFNTEGFFTFLNYVLTY